VFAPSVEQFPSCPRDKPLVALKTFHKTIKCKKGVYFRASLRLLNFGSPCRCCFGVHISGALQQQSTCGSHMHQVAFLRASLRPFTAQQYKHMAVSRASESESESPDCINTACAAAPQRGVICSTQQYTAGTKASAQDATPRNSIFPGWICDLKERFAI
jgi:hypothetical protein